MENLISNKEVRFELEKLHEISLFNDFTILNQVWGFEYNPKEINRAIRHGQQYPNTKPLFPLIEKGLDKNECAGLLINAGIELPEMYKLGYNNNNCIGCVKSQSPTYWNLVRETFPDVFEQRSEQSRRIGCKLVKLKGKRVFLDELPIDAKGGKIKSYECGIFCDTK